MGAGVKIGSGTTTVAVAVSEVKGVGSEGAASSE